jgi:hypothetical protein
MSGQHSGHCQKNEIVQYWESDRWQLHRYLANYVLVDEGVVEKDHTEVKQINHGTEQTTDSIDRFNFIWFFIDGQIFEIVFYGECQK